MSFRAGVRYSCPLFLPTTEFPSLIHTLIARLSFNRFTLPRNKFLSIVILKVGPGPATSALPGNSLETSPELHPRFKDQKLWGWSPAICGFISPPGDSETHSSRSTTNLEDELVPSLRIVRGVLEILKLYQNRSFKLFVSKVEVHVWPLQGAALVETGLQRRGCHSCHLAMNLSKFFSHLVSHLENERPALSTPQDYNEIQNETRLQTCPGNQKVL